MFNNFYVDNQFNISDNIPSTYGRGTSYYEELTQLITYVNQLYTQYVTNNGDTIELKTKYDSLISEITSLVNQFNNYTSGKTIPDGSVTLDKLSANCFNKLSDFVVTSVGNVAKFVYFTLSDDGYFIANIPASWDSITFETSIEGELILKF